MKLLKQLTIALALTLSLGNVSVVMAAGKVENATTAQVKEAIESALSNAKLALEGVKDNANVDVALMHIVNARQATKSIEVGTTLDPVRSKASTQLRTANTELKKDDKAKTEAALVEAIKSFEEIKAAYK
jgi:ribosome recycling factor